MKTISLLAIILTLQQSNLCNEMINPTAPEHSHRTGKNKFILITSLYNETDKRKVQEYLFCLKKNLAHDAIEKIHILYDTSRDDSSNELLEELKKSGAMITYIVGRPIYQYCFNLANQWYPNRKVILSNGDIFFNETLHLLDKYDFNNALLAITRWDLLKDMKTLRPYDSKLSYSQDTWIFTTPIKLITRAHLQLGTMGCDGLLAKIASLSGMKVENPSLSIQCCHLHLTNLRRYSHSKGPPFPLLLPLVKTKLNLEASS